MNRAYQVTAILLILLSLFLGRESLALRYYTFLGPGPGFFPLWLTGSLGVMGAILLYQATFRKSDLPLVDFRVSREGYLRVGSIILALVGVVVLLTPLGFRLSMFAFLVLLLLTLGKQKPIMTVLIAVGGSFGVYYVFVDWLRVPLPVGMLGI